MPPAAIASGVVVTRQIERTARPIVSAPHARVGLLVGLTLAALVLRVVVLVQSARLGADEAVEGLMARHILHGELPAFYWGQAYFGALLCFLQGRLVVFSLLPGLAVWVWQPALAGPAPLLVLVLLRRGPLAPLLVGLAIAWVAEPALVLLASRERAPATWLVVPVAGLIVLVAHAGARYLVPATLAGCALGGAMLANLAQGVRRGVLVSLSLGGLLVGVPNLMAYASIPAAFASERLSRLDDTQAAVDRLEARGLIGGYADYWTAYPITYLSGERIVVAPAAGADRYPAYTRQVASGSQPFALLDSRCATPLSQAEPVRRWLLVWPADAATLSALTACQA